MSYIVMGTDECGTEFRPSSRTHHDIDDAYAELEYLREQYQEARSMWVEEYRDSDYYMRRAHEQWDDEYEWGNYD